MLYLKTVVLGSGGVGKSALTCRYINSTFSNKYEPTIEDHYKKSHDNDTMMEVVDTAGTEQFTAMRDLYMKTGDAFIFVYTITSRSTFTDIDPLMLNLKRVMSEENKSGIVIVVVGNKCDLENEREIPEEEGKRYASNHGCYFMETSAKSDININEVFQQIVDCKRVAQTNKKEKNKKCNCVIC